MIKTLVRHRFYLPYSINIEYNSQLSAIADGSTSHQESNKAINNVPQLNHVKTHDRQDPRGWYTVDSMPFYLAIGMMSLAIIGYSVLESPP